MELDVTPLWISLKTGLWATVFCFFLGIAAAWHSMKAPAALQNFIDSLLTLPMALPPTAVGFLLLVLFSPRRPLGNLLYEQFHIKIVQSFAGCVLAASVISFPLMYRNAKAVFSLVDPSLIHAARTLGMSETAIFFRVVLPTAGPGIASGTVLAFARAMGEYGATSMLAGNISGKTETIAQKIAMVLGDGDYQRAGIWTALVLGMAFVIMLAVHLISGKGRRERW